MENRKKFPSKKKKEQTKNTISIVQHIGRAGILRGAVDSVVMDREGLCGYRRVMIISAMCGQRTAKNGGKNLMYRNRRPHWRDAH